jgi:hypothetical protein
MTRSTVGAADAEQSGKHLTAKVRETRDVMGGTADRLQRVKSAWDTGRWKLCQQPI